jgi:hypothetical protein
MEKYDKGYGRGESVLIYPYGNLMRVKDRFILETPPTKLVKNCFSWKSGRWDRADYFV